MKIFNVEGANWINTVEIDDTLYEKYSEMAAEAMAQSFDSFVKGDLEDSNKKEELELGLVMSCYEDGFKNNPDRQVICLSYIVAEDAGYPDLAKAMRQEVDKLQSQIRDNIK
jgi:hypothetical protein